MVLSMNAQQCLTFKEGKKQGLEPEKLDIEYVNAVHADTAVFAIYSGQDDEFFAAYQAMFKTLGKYLKENGMEWDKPARAVHKIYFNDEGKIDYWLYNFKGKVSDENQTRFTEIMNEFLKEYKFPIKPKAKFSQCGSASFGK